MCISQEENFVLHKIGIHWFLANVQLIYFFIDIVFGFKLTKKNLFNAKVKKLV